MGVCFVLLTGGAAFYVFPDILGHSGPPVSSGNELVSF